MVNGRRVIYVGDDSKFWGGLKKDFIRYFPKAIFTFNQINILQHETPELIFFDIIKHVPHIIYIDFSQMFNICFRLAKILQWENSLQSVPVVGVLDYLSAKERIAESLLSGTPFCYVKGGEFASIAIQPMYLAFPHDTIIPRFATAQTSRRFIAVETLKIGHITANYIYLEGYSKFGDQQQITLEQSIVGRKLLPAKCYRVSHVSEQNLEGDYTYSFRAHYLFIENKGGVSKGDVAKMSEFRRTRYEQKERKRMQELEEMRVIIAQRVKKWVEKNYSKNYIATPKVLVVDSALEILKQTQGQQSDLGYRIKVQSHLAYPEKEIKRWVPHFIYYRIDDQKKLVQKGESYLLQQMRMLQQKYIQKIKLPANSKAINTLDALKKIVEVVDELEDYQPYIIVFSEDNWELEKLRTEIGYDQVLVIKTPLSFDLIGNLLKKFQLNEAKEMVKLQAVLNKLRERNYSKYARIEVGDLKLKKIFINESDPQSWAYHPRQIVLKELSELEMFFESTGPISLYTTFKISVPVNCFITTVPIDSRSHWARRKSSSGHVNRAFIHGIGEKAKRQLRQEINAFFHDKG